MAVQPSPPEAAVETRGAALLVDGVSLAYRSSVAVERVVLQADAGQVVCVMGRNGAGKTTLLKGIVGILPARSGRIVLDEVDVTSKPSYRRARAGIGYVPQGRRVFAHLSVLENLLVALEPAGGRDTGQLDEVLALFPVLRTMSRRTAGVLSGGQQQQLAIGRALMGRPRLLLLDEPTEGIQPSIVEEIEEVIGSLRGRMTILLVEQFLDFALANADHCYVLESGSVAIEGSPTDLDEARLRQLLAV